MGMATPANGAAEKGRAHRLCAQSAPAAHQHPTLRRTADGTVFMTDNGNYIYDCRFPGIADPARLEAALRDRAGVVGTGLFLGIASVVLVADENRIEERTRG